MAKYCAHLRDQLVSSGGGSTVTLERAAWLRERTCIARLERQRLEAHLLPRDQVEKTWLIVAGIIRAKFLALPASMAVKLGTTRNAVERQKMLTESVHDILRELSTIKFTIASDEAEEGQEHEAV